MANSNMYLLIPKTHWNMTVPVHAYDYYINNGTDDTPDIISYTPTFAEVSENFRNITGDTIFSPNWDNAAVADTDKHAILKGEFTMITLDASGAVVPAAPGELTLLLQAGIIPLTQTQAGWLTGKWLDVNQEV